MQNEIITRGANALETRLLDAEEVVAVLVGDEVDGQTKVPEPPGAADAVQVRLGVLGEVEIDHHVDRLDVDTAGEQVCNMAAAAAAAAEEDWFLLALGMPFRGERVRMLVLACNLGTNEDNTRGLPYTPNKLYRMRPIRRAPHHHNIPSQHHTPRS